MPRGGSAPVPRERGARRGSACAYVHGGGGAWQPSRVPGEPAPDDAAGLGAANARLREVIAAKDAEIAVPRAAQEAGAEVIRRLERRLAMDSSNSGTPASKQGIAAGEQRKARQRPERERSKDRERGAGSPATGKGAEPGP